MNRNVESECGKVQVKGKDGLKGMSLGQIEDMIKGAVASNANLTSEFDRLRKGKVGKGQSKRLLYCKFMKDNLLQKWKEITGKKNSPVAEKPKSPVKKPATSKSPIIKQFNAENFPFVLETEGEASEPTNENEPKEAENIYNGNFEQPTYVPYVRNRRKEVDPLSGKPSRATILRIDAMIKRAKARGETLPEFKTTRNKLLWATAYKPKNGPPKPVRRPVVKRANKQPAKKPRAIMAKLPLMKFSGGNARITTQPKIVLATGAKLTTSEIKEATRIAEGITDKIAQLKKSNTNGIRKVLMNRYAAGNANATLKKLQNLSNFGYSSIRNVVRAMEFERAKVLKNLSEKPASPVEKPKQSFSMIPGGPTLANRARSGKAKKAANRTAANRLAISMNEKFAKMRTKRKAAGQPAVKMFITQRGPNVNSNSDSNENMRGIEVGSAGSSAGSNRGSAGSSPKVITQAEAKKILQEAKVAPSKQPKRSLINNLKNGKINLNSLNKNRLVAIASEVYAKARPGNKIPFDQANKTKLQKLIKLGLKKL